MNESAYRVETTLRLAQWRIDNLASCTYRKSHPFKIGNWNWHLSIEKNTGLSVKLYPEISSYTRDNPPIASFAFRVICSVGGRKVLSHTDVKDKLLKRTEDFVWGLDDVPLTGKLIVEVEFIDLKRASSNEGEPLSIWLDRSSEQQSNETALGSLGRMFFEGIHTDITIRTSDGSIGAHRAILSTRSAVFSSMFSYDLKEKQLSTINISDMTHEALIAFLNYIYGNIKHDEFLTHRLALIRAADKYDISDLKEACQESLLKDIDAINVLERLQMAHQYKLADLKDSCMRYLVKFGKIYDVRGELDEFLYCADKELIAEIFHEVLCAWRGF